MSENAVTAKKYTEKTYNKINFQSIRIGLASPEAIREWSFGEVTKPETINYRTLKPEADGLYCEKIFGPVKDWECNCGRYKRSRFKGHTCEKCGVKITKSKVRRERMGHIELASPVAHIWYSKGTPSRMAQILDIPVKSLEAVLYFNKYVVINPGSAYDISKGDVITEAENDKYKENYFFDEDFRTGMGAAAIKELLEEIDLDELSAQLREELENSRESTRKKILQRLRVVESFRQSGNRPEWMILDVVPVLPPDIRPMVQLEGGRFATSDLNDLYRRVLNRNNRLKEMMKQGAPQLVVKNELRMLQESVDSLIDNGKRGAPIQGANSNKRPLKSLSDMLRGKQGRFRQNLLGKRVDYSGRSVIVVGPELKMYQCGLPKEMALELFKPFVMRKMVELGDANNHRSAKKMIEARDPKIWDALDIVIKDHPVMLNRAPTLHRLGIQAFEPILVEGRAIKLHPLVCTAFNADFDGDQMAVHVPLSVEAQTEARVLMLAANNLLKPADGKPVTVPTQDMVLGSYYLTMVREDEKGANHVYRDEAEAIMAYDAKELQLHAPIIVRMSKVVNGRKYTALVPTTLGQIIFNRPVPQDLGFMKRDPEDAVSMLRPEIGIEATVSGGKIEITNTEKNFLVGKKLLGVIIDKVISVHGVAKASEVLDNIKNQGYKYSTRSGTTVSVFDAKIPETKKEVVDRTQEQIDKVTDLYRKGRITDEERRKEVIDLWTKCTNQVSAELTSHLDNHNPIHMMIDSGARGNKSQLNQLAGMRGLIANTAGQTIEVPIKANYREGLSVREYFIASRGARKGLADTALRTADSGYLTRRLVDVSQEIIVREVDCGCTSGFEVSEILGDERVLESLNERLVGRYLLNDLIDENTGEVLMTKDRMMNEEDAARIVAAGVKQVTIRSLLTCEARDGVCVKCYGKDLATGKPVSIGEAVGIIAAQSIGEPGTQLTMRTFHTGGVTTSGSDITQGLPRVEELFEARRPSTYGILSEIAGRARYGINKKGGETITVSGDEGSIEYLIPYGFFKIVEDGAEVEKGQALTSGAIWPQDILRIKGVDEVRNYLISQVQNTYRTQGVEVNDKHIEVIIHQMMRKSNVIDPGTTDLLPGQDVERTELNFANEAAEKRAIADGTEFVPATTEPTILGVTKAALATESFLSAASFQETTKVLTEAAIKGKTDRLVGLKENVIIGKLLPSGTGMGVYSDVDIYSTTGEDISHVHDPAGINYGGTDKN